MVDHIQRQRQFSTQTTLSRLHVLIVEYELFGGLCRDASVAIRRYSKIKVGVALNWRRSE